MIDQIGVSINVLPIRSVVRLHDGSLFGLITGINIRDREHITYEVSYWYQGQHYFVWLEEFEVESTKEQRSRVGFTE